MARRVRAWGSGVIASAAMREEQSAGTPAKSKRRFIDERDIPTAAIHWRTPAEKAKRLDAWRTAVGRQFASSARVLRVAWTLEWMFGPNGFAFPTDAYLERKLGVPVLKIQAALQDLERAGAIIRASVFCRGKPQRRIWPSTDITAAILPTVGNTDTPHGGVKHTPHGGETEDLVRGRRPKNRQFSSTVDAARKSAEIREARDRERGFIP